MTGQGTPSGRAGADRYARQVSVPGVGAAGQQALARARVLCIGAGGLGSPAALYLAAAGVGTIGIVDDDDVDVSNLHRQILHTTAAVGIPKTDSAASTLSALNPDVTVRPHRTRLTKANALELLADYDVVLDGADNFETRYIVSDATTLLDIPHVWASVLGAGGQLSVFHASVGPVFRDLFPQVPEPGAVPSCVEAGVLGVVPGILGVAMAAEALKLILNYGTPLIGTVQLYDMATGGWDSLPVRRNPAVARPTAPAQVGTGLPDHVEPAELAAQLRAGAESAPPLLVDVREPAEAAAGMIAGARLWPLSRLLPDPAASTPDTADPDGSLSALAGAITKAGSEPGSKRASTARTVVYCKSGARSARVTAELARAGVTVHDLAGGIDAFARTAPGLVTVGAAP